MESELPEKNSPIFVVELSFLTPTTIYTKQEVALTMLGDSEEHIRKILESTPYAQLEGFQINKIEKSKDEEINEEVQAMLAKGEIEPPPSPDDTKKTLN